MRRFGGHVLALDAVAARRAAHEHAALVRQVDREPVDLRLDHVGDCLVRAQPLRTSSAHLTSDSSFVTFSSDPIGSRCCTFWKRSDAGAPTRWVGESGATRLGVLRLERDQLVVEPVVLGVRHDRHRPRRGRRRAPGSGSSRSSAARAAAALEDAKQLLRVAHERVRLLPHEHLVWVDAAPGDGDGIARPRPWRRGCRTASRRHRQCPRATRPSRSIAARIGSGEGLCRSVSSDVITTSKIVLEPRQAVEGELDGHAALRRDDAEATALVAQPRQHLDDLPERLQLLVQRLVVLAIGGNEVVDPVGGERVHLRDEAGPADRRASAPPRASRGRAPSCVACFIDATIIGPESISVPSRSKRTTGKRIAANRSAGRRLAPAWHVPGTWTCPQ